MAIVKWKNRDVYNPWGDFKRLQDEINSLFNMSKPATTGLFEGTVSPALDVVENSDDFTITCELPGIDQKDLDVSIASNILTIKGEKKHEKESGKGKFYKKESWSGSFQRTLSLPNTVDAAKINAELKDGILKLVLPKREESKPKQISVQVQ